ncbi:hypothetical protein S96127_1165 [Yersinia pestis]|nr:hypothetical protein S96127_1165 [Yersinia pestis]
MINHVALLFLRDIPHEIQEIASPPGPVE